MAFETYAANFSAVLPRMRSVTAISADVELWRSGRATDITRSQVAAIELQIRSADDLYHRRQYDPALQQFRQARASIYALLHPGFDVNAYATAAERSLPVSAALERSLIDLSVRLTDSMRPLMVESMPLTRLVASDAVPEPLAQFMHTGFRESQTGDELLQAATAHSVSLLNDGKPEAAVEILSQAIAGPANGNPDPSMLAAAHLNLTSAFVQSGNPEKAIESARAAQRLFRSSRDELGFAQAVHGEAVATHRAGRAEAAQKLFTQASEALAVAVPTPTPDPTSNLGIAALSSAGTVGIGIRPILIPILPSRQVASTLTFGQSGVQATRDLQVLQPIAQKDATTLMVRVPGRADGWASIPVASDTQRRQLAKPWQVSVPAGDTVATFKVSSDTMAAAEDVITAIYQPRANAVTGAQLDYHLPDTTATTFYLTQLYAHSLAVKIGDCFHELGQFLNAETHYQQAAAYTFINADVEATALWIRLARNTVEWGDALYKNEDTVDAAARYTALITADGKTPDSFFYTAASLATPAAAARGLIDNLLVRPLPAVNWEIAYLVMTAFSRLQQLVDGLDFFGLQLSPIHTFEYLQSVARGFAQEAIQAEREFVNFTSRQEAAEATRRELETARAMATAEAESRRLLFLSALDDHSAAANARALALSRVTHANNQMIQYAASSSAEIWARAASQAVGPGQDFVYSEISELVSKLERGERITGPPGKLAAATTYYSGRRTRAYELQKMQDNIAELTAGVLVATNQLNAAFRRVGAAEVSWQASLQRAAMAAASVNAFDANFFTPDTWSKMANVMRDISKSYLTRAIRIGKLMERAYNFENDADLKVIKNDYGVGVARPAAGRDVRLLGGDMLLEDIDAFTYNAIATKSRKNSRIKDVLSISASFPAHFEEFRQTGLLSIETDLVEFDVLHPGFFGQRLEAVEVEVVGLLPDTGLNGTLSAGGVTSFRKKDNSAGKRIHQIDTMALSSFVLRHDGFAFGTETGVRGLFQGLGVGTTWQLHLPKRSNNLDFRRIFDVSLVLYYTAQFDATLRTAMLAAPPRAGETTLLRTFALRFDFPDIWYAFYQAGVAGFVLERLRLPANQTNFVATTVSVRVVTRDGIANEGIALRIAAPDGTSGDATTDQNGMVSSELPALAGLAGQTPIGAWRIEVTGGPSLLDGATLKVDRVYNIQFGLEYSFDFAPEVI